MKRIMYSFLVVALYISLGFAQNLSSTDGVKPDGNKLSAISKSAPVAKQQSYTGDVLYDNGSCINSFGTGPGGADGCVPLSADIALGRTCSLLSPYLLADDFTVSGSIWNLQAVKIYVMQHGPLNITNAYIRIWDGKPLAAGSNVVYGDLTSNRFVQTSFIGAYAYYLSNINDLYSLNEVVVKCDASLKPGHYYIEYVVSDDQNSWAFFSPAVTTPGSLNKGNAMQSVFMPNIPIARYDVIIWNNNPGDPINMDIPFQIYGSVQIPSNGTYSVTFPDGGEVLKGGSYTYVTWSRKGIVPGSLLLEYSTDAGQTWSAINKTPIAGVSRYSWLVPKINSFNCIVRLCNYITKQEYCRSSSNFTIVSNTGVIVLHPNPFNPATTISYQVPEAGPVTVLVYNSLGQQVSQLVNEVKAAGNYSVTFDGSGLSSGIYYAVLKAGKQGDIIKTVKMSLVK